MQQRVITSGFIMENGKVLLLKRGDSGFLAGHWEMPGGKLEFGEDPMCGILREVKEEASIDCEIVCPFNSWHYVEQYKGVETHFVVIDFILMMKPDQDVKPASGMVDAIWASKSDMGKLKMSPEMRKSVEAGFAWVEKNAA